MIWEFLRGKEHQEMYIPPDTHTHTDYVCVYSLTHTAMFSFKLLSVCPQETLRKLFATVKQVAS